MRKSQDSMCDPRMSGDAFRVVGSACMLNSTPPMQKGFFRASRSRNSHPRLQSARRCVARRLRFVLDDRQPPAGMEFFARSRPGALPRIAEAAGHSRGAALRLSVGQRADASLRVRRHGRQRGGVRKTRRVVLPVRRARARRRAAVCWRPWLRMQRSWLPTTIRASFCRAWSRRRRRKLSVQLEAVDSNGLLPLRATGADFSDGLFVPKILAEEFAVASGGFPERDAIRETGFAGSARNREENHLAVACCQRCAAHRQGEPCRGTGEDRSQRARLRRFAAGTRNARKRLQRISGTRIPGVRRRTQSAGTRCRQRTLAVPAFRAYFGARSFHEDRGTRRMEAATKLAMRANGSREGWWNMSANGESFLDELITWREVGYNFSSHSDSLRPLRIAAGLGAEDAERAYARRTRTRVFAGATGKRQNIRSAVERGADAARARRADPQLPADAVGKENSGVVAHAAGCACRA